MDRLNRVDLEILKQLPGYNCGSCGYSTCKSFAAELAVGKAVLDQCPLLKQARYTRNRICIGKSLSGSARSHEIPDQIVGVLDHYLADIILHPLPGETVCREVLLPLCTGDFSQGDWIGYRPLGCPVVHFAKILSHEGSLITVHVRGPVHREKCTPIGLCMVIGFEGCYTGKSLGVGETVRFLPSHCMMQKIHSGVVINLERDRVRLECIDLKVWAPPLVSKDQSKLDRKDF